MTSTKSFSTRVIEIFRLLKSDSYHLHVAEIQQTASKILLY